MKPNKAIATAAFMVLAGVTAHAEDAVPKWQPHIDFEGKAGTKRNLGEADLFMPLAQNDDTLLFGDIRTRMDDQSSREGNFGLGLRHMHENGWNLGVYGYFDRRRSAYHNYFNQATLGVEALGQDWDFRLNGYVPLGDRIKEEDSLNTAVVSGTSVIFNGGEERSLSGFDSEIGWRAPVFDVDADRQLRFYLGGYRFADSVAPTVQGPRARLEMTFDELPNLWPGARLALGAEAQHDSPRGSQGFLSARLRLPLDLFAGGGGRKLTARERRMADPIVRDIDVVTQAGDFGAAETVTQTAGGSAITVLNSATTAGDSLDTAVTAAGASSTVILSGTFQVTGGNKISLANAQTLTGTATVRNAAGRTATLNTGAAVYGTNVTSSVVQVNSNGTLSGLTITSTYNDGNGGHAVLVAGGAGGVTITNNTISMSQSGANAGVALGFNNNTSGTISGNTLTATGSGGATTMTAFSAPGGTTTITVTGNSMSASGGGTASYIASVGGATLNAGSTGNTRGSGTCNGAPTSGSIGFTNGTTCP